MSLVQVLEVLLIQCMWFRGNGHKLGDNIEGGATLIVHGVQYRLIGLLVHQGLLRSRQNEVMSRVVEDQPGAHL